MEVVAKSKIIYGLLQKFVKNVKYHHVTIIVKDVKNVKNCNVLGIAFARNVKSQIVMDFVFVKNVITLLVIAYKTKF